jgi:hypothetical protein
MVVIPTYLPNYYFSRNGTSVMDLSLFIMARLGGRDVEDGPFDISDNDRAVPDASRYASGETPVHDIFFVINGNLKLRAKVLDIIVVETEKAKHLVEFMGMRPTELNLFVTTGQYPLGLGIKFSAGYGIGIYLDDRFNYFGVVLNTVRRVFSLLFGCIYNVFSVFSLMHFHYLFLK